MMFIVICKVKKNSLKKRLANRELHLNHLKSIKKKTILAGPLLNKSNKPKGSILILNFEKKQELLAFMKNDPYVKVNLFEEVIIEKFKRVF